MCRHYGQGHTLHLAKLLPDRRSEESECGMSLAQVGLADHTARQDSLMADLSPLPHLEFL
jgi:hypothetical protein